MADRFPIQGFALGVPWSAAESAYKVYARRYGREQTLERLAERGGFGLYEFAALYLDKSLPFGQQDATRVERLIGQALSEALAAPTTGTSVPNEGIVDDL